MYFTFIIYDKTYNLRTKFNSFYNHFFIQQRIIKNYVFRMYSSDRQIKFTHKIFECILIIEKDNVCLKEVNQYSYTYYQI